MNEQIEKIDYTKAISITATLLLCAGIISQTVYYFFFNIPITEFLTLSEVLLLFTQDIIRYVLIIVILLFISILFNYNKPRSSFNRFFIKYIQTNEFRNRIWMYIENRKGSIIYYVFGIIMFFTLLKEGSKIIYLYGLGFSIEIIYFFIRFFLYESRRKLRLEKKLVKKNRNFDLFFTFTLHFVVFVVCWSLVDVQKVKYEQKFINVSFKLSSDILISSDSSSYYIGQTEKYLFYYNSKKDITTTFKKENVKEIYFGKIHYWQLNLEN